VLNTIAVALVYCGLAAMLAGAVSVVTPLRLLRIQTRQAGVMVFSARLGQGAVDILPRPSIPMPILDVVLRSGFVTIADRRSREIVLGTRLGRGVNAAINFRIEPAGNGASDLTTETRVFAADARASRAFAASWRVVYPGSAPIRVMWRRAIRLRAEA
jgi:hypothetical protein